MGWVATQNFLAPRKLNESMSKKGFEGRKIVAHDGENGPFG